METNKQKKRKHHDERSLSNFGNKEKSQRTKHSLRGSYKCLECDEPKKIMSVLIRKKILTAIIVLFSEPKLLIKGKSSHVDLKSVLHWMMADVQTPIILILHVRVSHMQILLVNLSSV